MSLLAIHVLGDPVLRRETEPVEAITAELQRLIDDMFETMQAAKGVGLAAPQIGVSRRVAVVDVGVESGPPLVLINPRIVESSDEVETAEEGCLSIPEIYGEVERPYAVVLEALDRNAKPYRVATTGFQARAVQHEIDHLDGILFLDRLSAVRRSLLLSKWKKQRKGQTGFVKEVTPEPAGEL